MQKLFHRRGSSSINTRVVVAKSTSKNDLFAFLRPAFASTNNLAKYVNQKEELPHAPSSVTTAQQDQALMMTSHSSVSSHHPSEELVDFSWEATIRQHGGSREKIFRVPEDASIALFHGEFARRARGKGPSQRRVVSAAVPQDHVVVSGPRGSTVDLNSTTSVSDANAQNTLRAAIRTSLPNAFKRLSGPPDRLRAERDAYQFPRSNTVETIVPTRRLSVNEDALPAAVLRQRRYAFNRPNNMVEDGVHSAGQPTAAEGSTQTFIGDGPEGYVRSWLNLVPYGEPVVGHIPWELPVVTYKPPVFTRKSRFNLRHMKKTNVVEFN